MVRAVLRCSMGISTGLVRTNGLLSSWLGLQDRLNFSRNGMASQEECDKKDADKDVCIPTHPTAGEVLNVEGHVKVPCCPPLDLETFDKCEVKFYYNQFIKYDGDDDGILTRWELNELNRERYGRVLNSTDLEKMLREMGLMYCEDKITFTDYMTHLQKRFVPYCLQELMLIFDNWDKDSDGRLDWFEFRLLIGHMGFDPDHPDLFAHFQKSDRDSDDMLEFDEFVEVYESMNTLSKRTME